MHSYAQSTTIVPVMPRLCTNVFTVLSYIFLEWNMPGMIRGVVT